MQATYNREDRNNNRHLQDYLFYFLYKPQIL
jgi:hypothetical protein